MPAKSQGREVLTIELISRLDLNGVTDIHVQVDESIYDLWLPINRPLTIECLKIQYK